jgi:hypothetical protein
MIDIENEVITRIANRVSEQYSAFITGEYVSSPASFPAVSVVEIDNYPYRRSMTNETENHVEVTYEINVYTNTTKGKKEQCKAIFALIDDEMESMGFVRMMLSRIPNFSDATIYRMTGRYRAVVSQDSVVYRR